MYFYQIGHGSFEDGDHVMLMHEKAFSEQEIEQFIVEVTPTIALQHQKAEMEAIQKMTMEDPASGDLWTETAKHVTFSDICDKVAKAMCERYGFQMPVFHQRCFLWGWADLFDKESWSDKRCSVIDRITKELAKNV